MQTDQTRKPGELGFAAILCALSLLLLYSAYNISGFSALSSPGTFPLVATSIMVITSATTLLRATRHQSDLSGGGFFAQIVPPAVGGFCGLIAVYAILFNSLGFLLASLLFLIAGFKFLDRRGWARTVLLALLSLVLVYIAFRLIFQVILPAGILPEGEILAFFSKVFSRGAE